jgi:lipopolysaccharide/colanic/teichoic acid biosynthesis glycosyltransferase
VFLGAIVVALVGALLFLPDLYRIENQSAMFDLEILFATIPVALFGKGAY